MNRSAKTCFLFILFAAFARCEAVTLRLTPGVGQIDLSGQIYDHRSMTFGIVGGGYQDAVWGQVRTSQIARQQYRERTVETGFGYTSYLPGTKWWLGGGAFTVNDAGVFVTALSWGQANYAMTPAWWLQTAVIGGSRNENGFEGGIGQSEIHLIHYGISHQFRIGGFASAGNGAQPGGGGVMQYTYYTKLLQVTTMACIGDFSHWFERETLLKYETPIRTVAVARSVVTLNFTPQFFTEGTVEYNRCKSPFTQKLYRTKEAESWFGNLGFGYRIGS